MSLIIFDIDGVLGNFEKLRVLRDEAHISAVAYKNKLSYSQAEKLFFDTKNKMRLMGKPSTFDTMLSLGISKDKFCEIMNSVSVENNIILTKNAKEVLSTLSKNNVLVALTNTPLKATEKTLQHLGLLEYFKKLYCLDQYNFIKPSINIFKLILTEWNSTNTYSVGDSVEKDLIPAKSVGIKTILFDPLNNKNATNIDYTISKLTELLGVIK